MEIKIYYNSESDQHIEINSESMKGLKSGVICGVFDNEYRLTGNKTDAIINTSIILDIGDSTIYRALKERNGVLEQ